MKTSHTIIAVLCVLIIGLLFFSWRRTQAPKIAEGRYWPAASAAYERYFTGSTGQASAALKTVAAELEKVGKFDPIDVGGDWVSAQTLVYWVRAYDLSRETGDSDGAEKALTLSLSLAQKERPDLRLSGFQRDVAGDRLISEINGDLWPVWRKREITGAKEPEKLSDQEVAARAESIRAKLNAQRDGSQPNTTPDGTSAKTPPSNPNQGADVPHH